MLGADSFPAIPRSWLRLKFEVPGVRVCCGRENESRESWVTAALPQQALCCDMGLGMGHRPSWCLGVALVRVPCE